MSFMGEMKTHRSVDIPVMYNVLTILDHMNGMWTIGDRGENILVGGFSHHMGILAVANAGKTALGLHVWTTANVRYPTSTGIVYEDEGTLFAPRINNVIAHLEDGVKFNMFNQDEDEPKHMILDGTSLYLDPFYDILEKESNERFKRRSVKKYQVTLPWQLNKERGNKMVATLFGFIDSASEANVTSAGRATEAKGVDASEGNTEFMREGLIKTKIYGGRFIGLGTRGDMCFVSTASLDDAGPAMGAMPGQHPEKQMAHLSNKKKMKQLGTSYKKRTSILLQFGQPTTGYKGTGAAEKIPKYIMSKEDAYLGNNDLEYVAVKALRCKTGASGVIFNIWRSQANGVLPAITNLEFLRSWGSKDFKDYGILNAGQYQFAFALMPEMTFRTTTIMPMFNADRRLRRATELLVGMKLEFYGIQRPEFVNYRCTPEELYQGIIDAGYDWDVLLGETRGYWQFLEDEDPSLPYLSILDLLKMRVGDYKPYWMK